MNENREINERDLENVAGGSEGWKSWWAEFERKNCWSCTQPNGLGPGLRPGCQRQVQEMFQLAGDSKSVPMTCSNYVNHSVG